MDLLSYRSNMDVPWSDKLIIVEKFKFISPTFSFGENLLYKRIKSFDKKDYDPVILQRTSRLVIDPSTIFGCAVTDRV